MRDLVSVRSFMVYVMRVSVFNYMMTTHKDFFMSNKRSVIFSFLLFVFIYLFILYLCNINSLGLWKILLI